MKRTLPFLLLPLIQSNHLLLLNNSSSLTTFILMDILWKGEAQWKQALPIHCTKWLLHTVLKHVGDLLFNVSILRWSTGSQEELSQLKCSLYLGLRILQFEDFHIQKKLRGPFLFFFFLFLIQSNHLLLLNNPIVTHYFHFDEQFYGMEKHSGSKHCLSTALSDCYTLSWSIDCKHLGHSSCRSISLV